MRKRPVRKMTKEEKIFERLGIIETKVDMTLAQATKTNGRVTILETRAEAVDLKFASEKGYKKGVSHIKVIIISILTFILGSVVVPIVAAYISNK